MDRISDYVQFQDPIEAGHPGICRAVTHSAWRLVLCQRYGPVWAGPNGRGADQ